MARKARVVIGAGFGDEGKGLVTDFLASNTKDCSIIRFNGGAQAGHTVVTPDGVRRVFSHFSSGSMSGAKTILSRDFVVNPILFYKEKREGEEIPTHINRLSLVTTPFDMVINQMVEKSRRGAAHGSCGAGFNETIVRSQSSPQDCIYYCDLANALYLEAKLDHIWNSWMPRRLIQLGLTDYKTIMRDLWKTKEIDEFAYDVIEFFLKQCRDFSSPRFTNTHYLQDNIIFEGAQGLLLDKDDGLVFPHLTNSNTGLTNVLELSTEMGIEELDVIYVTRSYLTRHGNGPLPHELPHRPYSRVEDATNIHNNFQGSLRFAYADLDLLSQTVHRDLNKAVTHNIKINPSIAITCMDQTIDEVAFYSGQEIQQCFKEAYSEVVTYNTGLPICLSSYGPSRKDVSLHINRILEY